jgi:hypothetical protein
MRTLHCYEDFQFLPQVPGNEVLAESYRGSEIVEWYSRIGDQLQNMLDNQEAARNYENADRLRAFLNTWREHEITGAINVDEIDPLKAAADQQAAAKWELRSYFSSLKGQLAKLIASEEELPRGVDTNQLNPMAGAGGALGGAPPMSPDFGPEAEPPTGLEGAEGAGEPGAAGAGIEPPPDEAEDKILAGQKIEPAGKAPRR